MFVHSIDPVLGDAGGVYLWWYGLSYALGFTELHLWFYWQRTRLGLTRREVYDISIIVPAAVLVGGRVVEVAFYEWPYYSNHPLRIPALWMGGMSTHGLLAGAAFGVWLFCRIHDKSFLRIADELVIPGAFLMGVGRIGNFIDGQIIGSVTDVPWAVKFPDAEGFRHPVVLYDGLKNILLIPLLLAVRNRRPQQGVLLATFIFTYAFFRIPVDIFREYPTRLLGLATGQSLNITMSVGGLALLFWFGSRARSGESQSRSYEEQNSLWVRRAVLIALLLLCLTIPSDWTQDIPARYGKRHPGLRYSILYPRIE